MRTLQPNKGQGAELRRDLTIASWIKDYQKENRRKYRNCKMCSWPHDSYLMCGMGATFGSVRLGGDTYYIDSSNVEFILHFVLSLGSGFHWKNEVFFDVVNDAVVVRHLEAYNNTPQVKEWRIPVAEWDSITKFVKQKRAKCTCGADRTGPSAEAHADTCPESSFDGDWRI